MSLDSIEPQKILKLDYLSRRKIFLALYNGGTYTSPTTKLESTISNACGNGICHDAAAFMYFLNKPYLNSQDFTDFVKNKGIDWISYFYGSKLNYKIWSGLQPLPPNRIIGFRKCGFFLKGQTLQDIQPIVPDKISHSAFTIGNYSFRGINGGRLGLAWESIKPVLFSPASPDNLGVFHDFYNGKHVIITVESGISYDTFGLPIAVEDRQINKTVYEVLISTR